MASKLRIAAFAAIFFGFIAAYGIYNFMVQQRKSVRVVKVETQNLVVALKQMDPGTTITKEMVKVASWTKSSVPKGTFVKPDQVIGKILQIKAHTGDPITKAKLDEGKGAGLTVRLTEGYRAMAVKVDEVIGVSGFIAPNDRVDVITTMSPPGKDARSDKVSKIVLQNKRVLSTASEVERGTNGKPKIVRSITLEVKPEEAERLTLSSLEGKIILALRGKGDEAEVATLGSTAREVLSIAPPQVAKVHRRARRYAVEMYTGGDRKVLEF